MRFVGGKARIAEEIVGHILKDNIDIKVFIEPFSGALNITSALAQSRPDICIHASDVSSNLIDLWVRGLSGEFIPPTHLSREQYLQLKASPDSALRTFVGYGCSFSGKYWRGFAEDRVDTLLKSGKKATNYCKSSSISFMKKVKVLQKAQNLNLHVGNYTRYDDYLATCKDLSGVVIYCDPPYASTLAVGERNEFSHSIFWDWVRSKALQGVEVYVSEYVAPDDFEAVWEKTYKQGFQRPTGQALKTEKLFKIREEILTENRKKMIIINNSLAYRQDNRSNSKMLENINRGMVVEQTTISLIVSEVLKELPDVEVIQTDQKTVDTAPDLVLLRGDKRVNIEVQTLKGFYNGYSDIGLCFHVKIHKMKHLNKGLSYICQDTGSGSRLGVYFLEPSKIVGLIERSIQIFGGKRGYVVPIKDNLVPGNNLDSTIPSIIRYLKE